MTKMYCTGEKESGFTLLELAVVLLILSVLAGGALSVAANRTQQTKIDQTNYILDRVEEALLAFRKRNNRLPCPADETVAVTAADFGVEAANPGTCTGGSPAANHGPDGEAVAGVVPAKTLGLPDEYLFDAWSRRLHYAVDRRITAANAFTTYTPTDSTIGDIDVRDESYNAITTTAVVLVMSFGANGHGAVTYNGVQDVGTPSSFAAEIENCDCDFVGTRTGYTKQYVLQRNWDQFDELFLKYDDILRYKLRSQLLSIAEEAY